MDAGEVATPLQKCRNVVVKTFGTSNFPFSVVRSIQHYWKGPYANTHQLQGSLMHDHLMLTHGRSYKGLISMPMVVGDGGVLF